MKKAFIIGSISIAIVLFILALPFLGFMFSVFVNTVSEEYQLKKAAEDHLEQKYQMNFTVDAEVNTFVGSEITAHPVKRPSYVFPVKKNRQGKWVDYFFDAVYKEQIKEAVSKYPSLEETDTQYLQMFFNANASLGKTYTLDEYPNLKISDSPIPLTIKLSILQKDEINRKVVLDQFQQVINMIENENLPNEELISTVSVDTPEIHYYYNYKIPRNEFASLKTIEDLKKYEEVKPVKKQ